MVTLVLLATVVPRALGPEDYGRFAVPLTIVTLGSLAMTLGGPTLMARFVPAAPLGERLALARAIGTPPGPGPGRPAAVRSPLVALAAVVVGPRALPAARHRPGGPGAGPQRGHDARRSRSPSGSGRAGPWSVRYPLQNAVLVGGGPRPAPGRSGRRVRTVALVVAASVGAVLAAAVLVPVRAGRRRRVPVPPGAIRFGVLQAAGAALVQFAHRGGVLAVAVLVGSAVETGYAALAIGIALGATYAVLQAFTVSLPHLAGGRPPTAGRTRPTAATATTARRPAGEVVLRRLAEAAGGVIPAALGRPCCSTRSCRGVRRPLRRRVRGVRAGAGGRRPGAAARARRAGRGAAPAARGGPRQRRRRGRRVPRRRGRRSCPCWSAAGATAAALVGGGGGHRGGGLAAARGCRVAGRGGVVPGRDGGPRPRGRRVTGAEVGRMTAVATTGDAASDGPAVSVVVPTRDRPRPLAGCLAALEAQTAPQLEVVVVDDGSVDAARGRPRWSPAAPRARLVRGGGRGPAAARNLGAGRGRGPVLCFTDDDCRPEPGLGRRRSSARVDAGADGGRGTDAERPARRPVRRRVPDDHQPPRRVRRSTRARDASASRRRATSPCRPTLHRALPFDERFPLAAGEDRDWCARLAAAGAVASRYEPAARVAHHQDLSLARFWRQQVRYGRGAHRFHRGAGAAGDRLQPPGFYLDLVRAGFARRASAPGAAGARRPGRPPPAGRGARAMAAAPAG